MTPMTLYIYEMDRKREEGAREECISRCTRNTYPIWKVGVIVSQVHINQPLRKMQYNEFEK